MEDLSRIAGRLVWWQTPAETLGQRDRFLCQVLALGTWTDVRTVWRVYGEDALKSALRAAPPGVFDERSWNFWNLVFGCSPVPPVPQRTFS